MQLAIFDIDGTLTDSFGFDVHYYAALARRLGVEDPGRSLESWTHVTDESIVHEYFALHGRQATVEDVEWTKRHYKRALAAHLHQVPQIPGASQFLSALRARPDWHVVFGTGNWGFAGEMKLDAGGVQRTGITVVGCDGRPERTAMMCKAFRVGELEAGRCARVVYVGDRHYDVDAAGQLGWPFVGRSAESETLTRLGASHVLPDFLDVPQALDALMNARAPTSQAGPAP